MRAKKSLMLMGIISLTIIFGTISFSTLVTGTPSAAAAGTKNLDIGLLVALSGFGSGAETLIDQGAKTAMESINEAGGITIKGQSYLINLIVEDTKGSAEGSVAAANKLVYDRKVKFVVGTVVPYSIEAVGTVTEPAKVLRSSLYNCATPSEYGPKTPYTFMGNDGTVESNTALLTYLVEAFPEVKTTVLVIPDDGSVPHLGPIMKRAAEKRGLKVLGEPVSWTHNTVDFTPIIAKALARKPDTLTLLNGWPAPVGAMLKTAREAGFTGPVTCGGNPCEDILKVAGAAAATNYFATGIVGSSPDMPPMVKKITPIFVKKFGHALYYNYWGFNGIYVLVKAIEAAQSLEPDKVKDSWENMKSIDSLYGLAPMGGAKTYGIRHTVCHPVAIQSLMNAKVKHVKWVDVLVP
jgi:branched-chain amino acid transport system substrate-binding protein